MRRWLLGLCFCLAAAGAAQEDEAGKANRLLKEGKRLEALPLFEDLVRDHRGSGVMPRGLQIASKPRQFSPAIPLK